MPRLSRPAAQVPPDGQNGSVLPDTPESDLAGQPLDPLDANIAFSPTQALSTDVRAFQATHAKDDHTNLAASEPTPSLPKSDTVRGTCPRSGRLRPLTPSARCPGRPAGQHRELLGEELGRDRRQRPRESARGSSTRRPALGGATSVGRGETTTPCPQACRGMRTHTMSPVKGSPSIHTRPGKCGPVVTHLGTRRRWIRQQLCLEAGQPVPEVCGHTLGPRGPLPSWGWRVRVEGELGRAQVLDLHAAALVTVLNTRNARSGATPTEWLSCLSSHESANNVANLLACHFPFPWCRIETPGEEPPRLPSAVRISSSKARSRLVRAQCRVSLANSNDQIHAVMCQKQCFATGWEIPSDAAISLRGY
jgi:hypothetical protein